MILNLKTNKGISLTSVMFTLALFSSLFLAFNQWTANQRKNAMKIYYDFQALHQVKQNGVQFHIQCPGNQIIVRFPQGEFSLKTE